MIGTGVKSFEELYRLFRRKGVVLEKEIEKAIGSVREAEHNIPITELKMVERVDVRDGIVSVRYHCLSPYCPALLVLATSLDLKRRLLGVEGVKDVQIMLSGHYMAEEINRRINGASF